MPRFADLLDDKLRALDAEPPARDEFRRRPPTVSHVVYTPLYNLHTVTQSVSAEPAARPARDAEIRAAAVAADSWAADARPATSRSAHPPLGPNGDEPAPASTRPAFHVIRPTAAAPAQPVRRLTAAQWRSLDALNRLGAAVRVDFSANELRSAFRDLARRYHPDRHPAANDAARRQLSQQFTTVRSSYETLLTALESPHQA